MREMREEIKQRLLCEGGGEEEQQQEEEQKDKDKANEEKKDKKKRKRKKRGLPGKTMNDLDAFLCRLPVGIGIRYLTLHSHTQSQSKILDQFTLFCTQ